MKHDSRDEGSSPSVWLLGVTLNSVIYILGYVFALVSHLVPSYIGELHAGLMCVATFPPLQTLMLQDLWLTIRS